METRPALLFIGLSALLLSGCVTIDFTQKVDRSGNSVIMEKIDLDALLSMNQEYADSEGELSDSCRSISENGNGSACSYDSGILIINRSFLANESAYFYSFNKSSEFPYVIYTLEVRRLPQMVGPEAIGTDASSAPHVDSDFTDPSARLSAATLKTAGAAMTYSIEMPGEITGAENGEIVTDANGKKTARYDVLKLMADGKYMAVRSRELDTVLLAILGGGAIVLVGGIVVAAVLLKAMKK